MGHGGTGCSPVPAAHAGVLATASLSTHKGLGAGGANAGRNPGSVAPITVSLCTSAFAASKRILLWGKDTARCFYRARDVPQPLLGPRLQKQTLTHPGRQCAKRWLRWSCLPYLDHRPTWMPLRTPSHCPVNMGCNNNNCSHLFSVLTSQEPQWGVKLSKMTKSLVLMRFTCFISVNPTSTPCSKSHCYANFTD